MFRIRIIALFFLGACLARQSGGSPHNFGHIDYSVGLSHNHVLCFAKDNKGFLWIGTRSGLNRYDGYDFKTFKHVQSDSSSLPDNAVESIVKDQLGRFWIGMPDEMCLLNPENETFTCDFTVVCEGNSYSLYNIDMVVPAGKDILYFRIPGIGIVKHNIITNENRLYRHDPGDSLSISDPDISHMLVNGQMLYIAHRNGGIEILDTRTDRVTKRINAVRERFGNVSHDYEMFLDHRNDLWLFCHDEALGVWRIDRDENVRVYNTDTEPALNSNIISVLIQDPENNIWIGTDHGGINIVDRDLRSVEYVIHEPYNENSLSQNVITELYMGSDSIIWIGTFKQGVNYYHKKLFRFYHYSNYPNDENTLPYNDVNCFAEDASGNLWIGTNGQGLIYFDRKNNRFTSIQADPDAPYGLRSNVIVALLIDRDRMLWVGTYHGGLASYDGRKFTCYMHDPEDPSSLKDNKVWDVFEDSHRNLWIGTLGGGLDMFDRDKKVFYHYSGTGLNKLNSDFVMDIDEDDDGNIWFGTENGVFILDFETSRFINLLHDNSDPGSLSDNFVYNVLRDSRGNMWAGTKNGLNFYVKRDNSFIRFDSDNGLPDDLIMSMLESDLKNLWVGTSNGLSKLVVSYGENGEYLGHYTVNFNESDGLQGREFNEGSAFKTSRGELIFGGSNGFNLFRPENDPARKSNLVTQIVGIEIFGEEQEIDSRMANRKRGRSPVAGGETLKLSYSDYMFSIKFVMIDFLGAKKINYRYKLTGFNDQWIYTGWEDRKATFTNLDPGSYVFHVQASDYRTDWEDSESHLNIVILPPWYRTWEAYLAYSILLVSLVILLRYIILTRERNKYQKEQAIEESERQHELNIMKTRFFTNVSHEFRTPLTLIISPLERMLKTDLDSGIRKHLELMYQNSKRLLNLVNQLLDFRKAEENKLGLTLIYGNIVGIIEQAVNSFNDLKESRHIQLKFLPYDSEVNMQFDRDKIEKIIINLLSNAFKFTPEGGRINVITRLNNRNGSEIFEITVEDNGIGINKENQEKLFQRFYQSEAPDRFLTKGSGIGLSLTKDFVELHNGEITVDSESGKGSRFTIILPVNREIILSPAEEEESELVPETSMETVAPETESSPPDREKKTILLVEDNAEFRSYLSECLADAYNRLEAEDGKTALDLLEKDDVDLVVSDIMMPVMDGIQLCNTIKTDTRFSHIPIILLTAKSTQEDHIEGLKQGADDYITKPFSFEILESRIAYLLNLRQKFIREYQKSLRVEGDQKSITTLDEKLLERILSLVNDNLTNTEFSVAKLSRELGMSRVNLYKKTRSLTGKTPIELIRMVRLKKAAELLLQSQLTISEITYEVGFSDPRYFSRQFKAEFKVLPSKFKESSGL